MNYPYSSSLTDYFHLYLQKPVQVSHHRPTQHLGLQVGSIQTNPRSAQTQNQTVRV